MSLGVRSVSDKGITSLMNISTTSWHYKLVKWHCDLFGHFNPRDLCSYIRRLTLWLPLTLLGALLLHCLLLPITVIVLLAGYYPGLFPLDVKEYGGLRVSWLPFEIRPWHIVLPTLFVWLQIYFGSHWGMTFFKIEGSVIGSAIVFGAIIFGIFVYSESETKYLLSNWFEAKTKRFCPTIKYVDQSNQEQSEEN